MELTTQIRLITLAGLLVLFGLTLGYVLVLTWLLNARDRRRSRVYDTVRAQLDAQDVRECAGIEVGGALLSRKSIVTVDMRSCASGRIWETVTRLSRKLPGHVRLAVEGTVDRQYPVRLIVKRGHPVTNPRETVPVTRERKAEVIQTKVA